jgi:REP-associated tyrosine transposase
MAPAHRQLDLDLPSPRGGARPRAGRKPRGPRPSEPHRRRPVLDPRAPLHVVIRGTHRAGRLRGRAGWRAMRHALIVAARRPDFRICHASIQRTHVHLIVEASDRIALARGMQGFQIACARRYNRLCGTSGPVFADRYHAVALRGPRQVHHALAYVLNNWRRHRADAGAPDVRFDPFSSAPAFPGWRGPAFFRRDAERLPVVLPTTWLLAVGWRRHGEISPHARPGPRTRARTGSHALALEPRDELAAAAAAPTM